MLPMSFCRNWTYCESHGNMIFDPGAAKVERTPVTLPHDAMIHEKRSADAPGGTAKGYYPSKDYDYYNIFEAPAEWADKRVWLFFEGAYMNARVYVNGAFAGQRMNGYTEFSVLLSDHLRYGQSNEIKVSVQTGEDSRWYSGAGLYRNVSLYVADPLHVDMDGFRLTTVSADETVAAVQADVTIVNQSVRNRHVTVEIELRDPDGNVACFDTQPLRLCSLTTETIHPRLYVSAPRLWSPDSPELYTAEVRLTENGTIVDTARIDTFGIRVLTLDPVHGLAVNGRTVKLYGGCIHHDNGILGSATFEEAEERRARIMRNAGYNALRSAHHPMSRAMLSACDRVGLLVMDELTDMWHTSKTVRDFGSGFEREWEDDVRSMVAKDANHPCVVMYSMGNEIPESGTPAGAAIYRHLAHLTRSLDSTRYITAGINNLLAGDALSQAFGGGEGGINQAMGGDLGDTMAKLSMLPPVVEATRESYESLDICGFNYAADRYLHDHAAFTNRISVGSETFPKDLAYNWKLVEEHPHVLGDFVWTSWDYLGEAGIGRDHFREGDSSAFGQNPFPWRIAWDADFDITGRQTPQGVYREIVIGHRKAPFIAMQDPSTYDRKPFATAWSWPGTVCSWNWPGFEGKPIRIDVYAKGDEAELIVNGTSLGRRLLPRESGEDGLAFMTTFEAVYAPGKVEAVIYENGMETARCAVESAGEAAGCVVVFDREELRPDGIAFADLRIVDAQGRPNNGEARPVSVKVEGAGVLQGLGSGDPCTEEDYFDTSCRAFFGHAFAAVRACETGTITVTVEAEGLPPVVKQLTVR